MKHTLLFHGSPDERLTQTFDYLLHCNFSIMDLNNALEDKSLLSHRAAHPATILCHLPHNGSINEELQPLIKHFPAMAVTNTTSIDKTQLYNIGISDCLPMELEAYEIAFRIRQFHTWHLLNNKIHVIEEFHSRRHRERHSKAANLVNRACDYLLCNLDKPVSLDGLSSLLGTNRNTLSKAFRLYKKTTVFSWLRQQRMLKAQQLLNETDDSILVIALETGFEDPSNFSTCYKKYFHLSPKRHRKIMRESNAMDTQASA